MTTLALLMGFASISTDFYLPALPMMARDLRVGQGAITFTVTGFLLGFAAGQLAWGPLSDRYGRKKPVLVGLALFVLGSVGCALAVGPTSIVVWRLVQALGASAGVVLSRAMVRDLYEGAAAARMLSFLMAVMAVAPLAGPLVGGQILTHLGWRAVFWTLVLIGALTGVAVVALPETLSMAERGDATIGKAFRGYGIVFRDRVVMANAAACGFFYVGTFAYVSGSPFAYIEYHGLPAQFYGLVFGTGVLGIVVLNLINARLVRRFAPRRLLLWAAAVAAIAGIGSAIDARFDIGGVAGLAIPIFFFVAVTGVVVANALAEALEAQPRRTGAVAAVVGAVQYGSGVVGSAAVGWFSDGSPFSMGLLVALGGIGCVMAAAAQRSGVE